MLATAFPLLDIFLSMVWLFLFFLWAWLLISIFVDIFRSHDMGGNAKAAWVLFIVVLPLLGVLIYLIARGGSMHERTIQRAQSQQRAVEDYLRQVAGGGSPASELATVARLHDEGKLTDADFEKAKAKILD